MQADPPSLYSLTTESLVCTSPRERTSPVATENFIGGKWVAARDGRTDDVVNPATGAVIETVSSSDTADVEAAVDAAAGAFEEWSTTTPRHRAEVLHRVAQAVADGVDTLSEIEMR